MGSYKQYNKIAKIQNGFDYSKSNKEFWYTFYMDYFIELLNNYYQWDNLPDSIDPLFLEKKLHLNGFVGFFEDKEYGLIVSRGTLSGGFDIYENPVSFKPVNNSNFLRFKKIDVNWYDDNLSKEKAVIIENTSLRKPSIFWLGGFCEKLADIEQTIQLNRNAQIRPFVLLADSDSLFTMKNLFNKILNGDPVIYLKKQKNRDGNLEATQLNDMVTTLETNTPFLLDKLHDEKQRVINQVLTRMGINNNAVDKAERLVSAEATSNNGLINASIEIGLKSRKIASKRINSCWGLNTDVRPSENIKPFNTEEVYKDTEEKVDVITEVV